MSQTDLTLGALARIVDGEDLPEPVVQVLGHKEITVTKNDQKTLRLLLNDGKYSYSFVMLSTQLGHLVLENAITPYMVIKVKKYVCYQMANQGKKTIIILDLEVLQRGELVWKTIGNPNPIGSDGKVPIPATSDQHAGTCAGFPISVQEGPNIGQRLKYLLQAPMKIEYCLNCSMNKWKQPEDKSILRKCEKCQVVSYCGKECQEEHWEKVHKEHCRYLAGEEKAKHSEHNKETCNYCADEAAAGEGVSELSNPTYFCTFAVDDCCCSCPSRPPKNSPFPLSGLPGDRCERMINATQRIILKIQLTNHPVEQKWSEELETINDVMIYLKRLLHILRITLPHRDYLRIRTEQKTPLFQVLEEFLEETRDADNDGGAPNPKFSDGLQMLKTLRLIFLLFLDSERIALARLLKSPDRYVRRNERALFLKVREGSFLTIADHVPDALEHHLVPYSDLVAIACGGNTKRQCTVCAEEVRIEDIVHTIRVARWPSVYISPIDTGTYTCAKPRCALRLVQLKKYICWSKATGAIYEKLADTRCDSCYLNGPLKEVHRSRCLTKNYCSQECRNADDKFHNICCGQQGEVDKRKVKVGGKEKVIKGNERVDRYARAHILFLMSPDDSIPELGNELKKIIDKVKKVKI